MNSNLYFQTADIAAPLGITKEREEVMDFSFPSHYVKTVWVYKLNANPTTTPFFFLRPFKWQVWICMSLVIPAIGTVIWTFGHAVQHVNSRKKQNVDVQSFLVVSWSITEVVLRQSK